jgi:hypothetical protein
MHVVTIKFFYIKKSRLVHAYQSENKHYAGFILRYDDVGLYKSYVNKMHKKIEC